MPDQPTIAAAQKADMLAQIATLRAELEALKAAVSRHAASPAGLARTENPVLAMALARPWISATLFSLAAWLALAQAAGSVRSRLQRKA